MLKCVPTYNSCYLFPKCMSTAKPPFIMYRGNNRIMSLFCSLFSPREQMKSLQEVLQNQLKETTEKAEKQQATVSMFLSRVLCSGAGKSFFKIDSVPRNKIKGSLLINGV